MTMLNNWKNSLVARLSLVGFIRKLLSSAVGDSLTVLKEWAGTVNYPSSAVTVYIASTDNGDAQEVTVYGLNGDHSPILERITLTGQTQVALTKQFKRVNRMVLEDGSVAAGDIVVAEDADWTAGSPDDANSIFNKITAGKLESESLIFSVPADIALFVLELIARVGSNAGEVLLETSNDGGTTWVEEDRIVVAADSRVAYKYEVPIEISEKVDLRLRGQCTVGASTTDIQARIGSALY